MTWREVRDRLNLLPEEVLDSPAIASCDPLDCDPELGFRFFGEILELNPDGDPQRMRGLVACFEGEANY